MAGVQDLLLQTISRVHFPIPEWIFRTLGDS